MAKNMDNLALVLQEIKFLEETIKRKKARSEVLEIELIDRQDMLLELQGYTIDSDNQNG